MDGDPLFATYSDQLVAFNVNRDNATTSGSALTDTETF
jgi:hypothetical protein